MSTRTSRSGWPGHGRVRAAIAAARARLAIRRMRREFDLVLSDEILARNNYINERAVEVVVGSKAYIDEIDAGVVQRLDRRQRSVTWQVDLPSRTDVDMAEWSFRLADLMFNVRATLDNVMWLIAHDDSPNPLNEKQEGALYFPLRRTEKSWNDFVASPFGRAVRPKLLERLEAVQPFRLQEGSNLRGLLVMDQLHRTDKHRVPLALQCGIDLQLPVTASALDDPPSEQNRWVARDWFDLNRPVFQGMPIVRLTSKGPPPPDTGRGKLELAPYALYNGVRHDLQDFVWDMQGGLQRVIDTVCLGNTFRSDLWDAEIAWRREGPAALRRSLIEGTNEWEDRGFDRPSPYAELFEKYR